MPKHKNKDPAQSYCKPCPAKSLSKKLKWWLCARSYNKLSHHLLCKFWMFATIQSFKKKKNDESLSFCFHIRQKYWMDMNFLFTNRIRNKESGSVMSKYQYMKWRQRFVMHWNDIKNSMHLFLLGSKVRGLFSRLSHHGDNRVFHGILTFLWVWKYIKPH